MANTSCMLYRGMPSRKQSILHAREAMSTCGRSSQSTWKATAACQALNRVSAARRQFGEFALKCMPTQTVEFVLNSLAVRVVFRSKSINSESGLRRTIDRLAEKFPDGEGKSKLGDFTADLTSLIDGWSLEG